jgi:hypothetical protein
VPGATHLRGNRLFQMLTLRPAIEVPTERIRLVSLFLGASDWPGFMKRGSGCFRTIFPICLSCCAEVNEHMPRTFATTRSTSTRSQR